VQYVSHINQFNRNEIFKNRFRLDFNSNKNIRYLPENVVENFPLLIGYYAESCTITEILRKHFKGLLKLKVLILDKNQIEKIENSAFDDLVSLENLIG
jgi:Leucine rich repeat